MCRVIATGESEDGGKDSFVAIFLNVVAGNAF